MQQPHIDELRRKLEEAGEPKVRENISLDVYSQDKLPHVNHWLDEQMRERTEAREDRDEDRAEQAITEARQANDLSKEANETSRRSNLIAYLALGLAFVAFVVSLCSA